MGLMMPDRGRRPSPVGILRDNEGNCRASTGPSMAMSASTYATTRINIEPIPNRAGSEYLDRNLSSEPSMWHRPANQNAAPGRYMMPISNFFDFGVRD